MNERQDQTGQVVKRRLPQVMGVEPQELVGIESGSGTVQVLSIKKINEFLHGEQFLIPVRPAEADEAVDQRVRQEAVILVLHHGTRAVTLGKLLAVLAEDHGT